MIKIVQTLLAEYQDYDTETFPDLLEIIENLHSDGNDEAENNLTQAEQLMLAALIMGLQPEAILELGTGQGRATALLSKALDTINRGHLLTLDKEFSVPDELWKTINHRTTFIKNSSPDYVADAFQVEGNFFDFIFFSGKFAGESLLQDLKSTFDYLTDRAYLLIHNSYNQGRMKDIEALLTEFPEQLQDCGNIVQQPTFVPAQNEFVSGLRLLIFNRSGFLGKTQLDWEGLRIQSGTEEISDESSHKEAKYTEFEQLTRPSKSYIICSNYRSGSTLLLLGLEQTKIAGKPHEYFHPDLTRSYMEQWGIDPDDYVRFLDEVIQQCMTSNQVFGVKIMYPDIIYLIKQVRKVVQDYQSSDHEILEACFPNLKFIYISRQDKLRQAISMVRSSQSKVWHVDFDKDIPDPIEDVKFDFDKIEHDLVYGIIRNEIRWEQFFVEHDIIPLRITYEKFVDNYSVNILRALRFLQIPELDRVDIGEPPLKKLADDITEEWVRLYHEHNGFVSDSWVQENLENGNYAPLLSDLLERQRVRHRGQIERLKSQHAEQLNNFVDAEQEQ